MMQKGIDENVNKNKEKVLFILQFFVITAGFSALLKISSEYLDKMVYLEDFSNYYVSYLVCYGLGIASLIYNTLGDKHNDKERYTRNVICAFSILFALMITGANYALWLLPTPEYASHLFRNFYRLSYMGPVFLGSVCASYNFFSCVSDLCISGLSRKTEKNRATIVFVTVFILAFLVDFVILMLCKYPGNLTTDSFAQIYQATGDFEYNNHHPFYHTLVVKLFFDIGMAVFNDYNAAVAVYSCFQILFMAVCFAYSVRFLYELKAPRWMLIIAAMFYVIAPYHIMYSFSMTKDVMFGGFVLISVVATFRVFKGMGKNIINYAVVILSGLGVCLFRSNGFFAYIIWFLSILLISVKILGDKVGITVRRLLFCMAVVIAVGFIMKHPLLKALNVSQTDFVEALSVPIQQIGRTVVDNDDLTEDEKALLSKVLSVDKIRESYYRTTSDPIKERIRAEGDGGFLSDHKMDYLKLYIEIGIRHPGSYLAGWIDQTSGVWNAGYKDWHWYDWVGAKIYDNRYNINRTVKSERLNNAFNEYLWICEELPILQLTLCMGFHMWIVFVVMFIAMIRRDRDGAIITLPLIWIFVSLLIATPDSMAFRYSYTVFCVLPVLIPVMLRRDLQTAGQDTADNED